MHLKYINHPINKMTPFPPKHFWPPPENIFLKFLLTPLSQAPSWRGRCGSHVRYVDWFNQEDFIELCHENCFGWIVLLVLVTNERHLALLTAMTICQRSSPMWISYKPQAGFWTYAEPGLRLSWMKLCSSDNQYTNIYKNIVTIRFSSSSLYSRCSDSKKHSWLRSSSNKLRTGNNFSNVKWR